MIVHLEHIIHHDHKYINNSLNGLFAYFSENQDKNVFRYDKKKEPKIHRLAENMSELALEC